MTLSKRLNPLDALVLLSICLSVLGFGLAQSGHAGVDKIILGPCKVQIDVYLSGFKTVDPELFRTGDKAFLTIRNQPVDSPMSIVEVKHNRKQVAFLAPDGKKALAFDDPSQPIAHDFIISLLDSGERTKDGFVLHGNKIKVGNTIEIESPQFRVQGVVCGLKASP